MDIPAAELKTLINIGYFACLSGKVVQARQLFVALQEMEPQDAQLFALNLGEALSHMVVDDFTVCDDKLRALMASGDEEQEACAFLALSLALQKKGDEVQALVATIKPEHATAHALGQSALSLLA